MKKFSSELGQNYDTYTFGYTNYCQRESGDPLSMIYHSGFLPYSGSPEAKDIFYMARSARIHLPHFEFNSENRRIAKKFDDLFTKERIAFADFNIKEEFYAFCLQYFAAQHGTSAMSRERLEYIVHSGLITNIIIYRDALKPVAYVLEIGDTAQNNSFGHYWFSFYDLSYAKQSLGLWLILDALRSAKKDGREYYYLGTVYGEKALYKTNFEPLEWWDGEQWNTDIKLLKERGRTDFERALSTPDAWKKGKTLF